MGSIAVTVREENGTEHRMCRETYGLQWFLKNVRLLNKDPSHVRKYTSQWYKSIEDPTSPDRFGKEVNETHAPHKFLAPDDQGLVVVDIKTNQILSYGFSSPEVLYGLLMQNDMDSIMPGKHLISSDPSIKSLGREAFYMEDHQGEAFRFRELFEAGRILRAENARDRRKAISLEGIPFNSVIDLIEKSGQYLHFVVDITPYSLVSYEAYNPEEARKLHAKIKSMDFKLSNEEEIIWNEWINKN